MREINEIFIHHSASNWGNAKLINEWHKESGWKGIGYHFVVLNGYLTYQDYKDRKLNFPLLGKIEKGRDVSKIGAHVKGHNRNSIGICLIHKDLPYTEYQLEAYRELVILLAKIHNVKLKNIRGHYEVDLSKSLCPYLDMSIERTKLGAMLNYITCKDIENIKTKYLI